MRLHMNKKKYSEPNKNATIYVQLGIFYADPLIAVHYFPNQCFYRVESIFAWTQ
jgi:hypothetical protein